MSEWIPPQHIVAACGLVRDTNGHILMVNNTQRGWEVPGGQVEVGESLIDGLMREILEESGAIVTAGALACVYSNIKPPTKVIFGFLCDYVSGDLTPSDETPEVAWVKPEDALARVTHPAIIDRVRDLLVFDGRVKYRVYETDPYRVLSEQWM